MLSAARAIVQRFDSRLPLIFPDSMSAIVDGHLARPRFYLLLLALFAGLAVLLAAVGIYGVVAYVVSQRTREIGVRMALGAQQRDVVGLMLWQGLRPAAIGVAVGLVSAIAAGRALGAVLYTVSPYDPVTLAGVTGSLAVIVVIACVIPAGRASRVPPGEALRGE